MPSLFETRGCLQTSATNTTCEQPTGTLDPRRDGGLDLLPFLDVPRLLPCGSGDTRRAALRPNRPAPVLVLPTRVGLPNRDAGAVAPPRRRFWRPVHSEDRRARVEGPSEGRVCRCACDDLSCLRRCMRFEARIRDDVPLLGDLQTPAVIGAPLPREDTRERRRTDRGLRSDGAPRRAPPSRRPGCLRPPRHVKECTRRDCSLRPSRRLSRSRRPHFFPRWGRCFGWGIARSRCGHPRIREHREYRRLFDSLDFRAWD